jgi:uncharacterized secreted repeat protein (TIGR03808 family)
MLTRRATLQTMAAALLVGDAHAATNEAELQQKIQRGGRVVVGAGTINLSQPLQITAPVTLQGIAGQSVLRGAGLKALVEGRGAKDVVVSGLVFEGGEAGLTLEGCSGAIQQNTFRNQTNVGLFSNDARGLDISGNTVSGSGNNGIQVWRSAKGEDGSFVRNNRISNISARDGGSGQNGNGVNVFRAGNVIVSGNRISDCAYSAVRNNGGSNCQIFGNNISRTKEVAIYVEFEFEGTVVASNVIEDTGFGISITNFDVGGRMATVSGNIIRRARGSNTEGVKAAGGIFAEADTVISGNVIEDARDFGIGLGWGDKCRNLLAYGNIIRRTPKGITVSVSQGAQQVRLVANTFEEVSTRIEGRDYDKIATGELISGGAPANVLITP